MDKKTVLLQAMRDKTAALPLVELVVAFEQTNRLAGDEIPHVRGVLMDELESRDAQAFENWILSSDESPRFFFLPA